MSLDIAQRAELKRQVRRVFLFFVASIAGLLAVRASARLLILVLAGVLLISGFRLWASTRYGMSGPAVYARMIISRHLTSLITTLDENPGLRRCLDIDEKAVQSLRAANESERLALADLFRRAGYPRSHEPAHLTVFLLSAGSFIVGLAGGVLLPRFAQADFQVLCGASLPRALAPPPIVLVLAVVTLAAAAAAKASNARLVASASNAFADDPLAALRGLAGPAGGPWRRALNTDLQRAVQLIDISAQQAIALQGLGLAKVPGRESWYGRLRWSAETDLVIAQVQLVLGLYLGLMIPPLLHIGC